MKTILKASALLICCLISGALRLEAQIEIEGSNCATPPDIAGCPSPGILSECTGGLTPVSYTLTAVDCEGSLVPVICVPPSGSGFRIGNSNVICTATDFGGQSSKCIFTVTIQDTTAPRVTCPSNINVAATSPSGAVVTYIAAASDPCGIASFDCSPPSGSTFPPSTTTVACSATDSAGNSNSCSFLVLVIENHCPVADPLSETVAEGGSVNFQLPGSDQDMDPLTYLVTLPPLHGTVTVQINTGAATYSPAPGYCGPDSFKYSVSDGQCQAEGTVSITVTCCSSDTTPPDISCPIAPPVCNDPGLCSAVVTFIVGVSDNCTAVPTLVCVPANGSAFPLGITTVTCTATDDAGNTNICSFDVTVNDCSGNKCPRPQGFWKNNPAAWPVSSLMLGSQTYTQAELLALLKTSTMSDASLILARQLIPALLNTANGSSLGPVCDTINAANSLLNSLSGKLPYKVKTNTVLGKQMVQLASALERYNNGLLTPGCTP